MTKKDIIQIKQTKKLVVEEEHKRDRNRRGSAIRKNMMEKGKLDEFTIGEVVRATMGRLV